MLLKVKVRNTQYHAGLYFYLLVVEAKDTNAERAGEAGEVDGAGVRGSPGEREQPCQRNKSKLPSHRYSRHITNVGHVLEK